MELPNPSGLTTKERFLKQQIPFVTRVKQLTHDTIGTDFIRQMIKSEYRFDAPIECKFVQRSVNDTYCVRAGPRVYYLRIYRYGFRARGEIEAEIDLLNQLHKDGQPVAVPIPASDGTYLLRLESRFAVLFGEAVGKPPVFNDLVCAAYGELIGHLHEAADKFPTDSRRFNLDFEHLIDEPLKNIAPYFAGRLNAFKNLQRFCNDLKSGVSDLLEGQQVSFGACHGDLHNANVHQSASGELTLFDFDCFGYSWRAYDLAVFRWQASGPVGLNGEGNAQAENQWAAFLDGYRRVCSITSSEIEATRLLVGVRRIWWIGLHARLGNLDTLSGNDRKAWFDYNIGLARAVMD
jgi:Ser/Thr protein kinase RdoA (MazF antagonist)